MKIYYGSKDIWIDVTNICLEKLTNNNNIVIPSDDCKRASYFTDPLVGIHKKIMIEVNDQITEYDEFTEITINILTNNITHNTDIIKTIKKIHLNLKIKYGSFNEELPEQKMAAKYLNGKEKVLEIGGNIGRNSLVIAALLEKSSNLVTLESDVNIAKQLTENRDLNQSKFNIESSALSNRKLIQKGWDTVPSDILKDGYSWVNTITLENLKNKYNIEFDTLVLDCEGAFYYILMDMPEILTGINLIIMENDYHDISHKNYIDDILLKNNFAVEHTESGGWGPCYNNFFEVWKRRS